MKIKSTLLVMAFLLSLLGSMAQTSCIDLNGYVNSKNQSGTGYYTLTKGYEEYAAQSYHYTGPGKVSQARIYGHYPGTIGGIALRVSVFNVDANGRPTSALRSENVTWWSSDNAAGFIDVSFGDGGVMVSNNYAVEIELRSAAPFGDSFQIQYTGDGEGRMEDLASLAGTSTGFNWSSASQNFSKEGDFYLIPKMTNFISSDFSASSQCVTANTSVTFANKTLMTMDTTFNTIGMWNYAGSNHYYLWNFGDGSAVSYLKNPTHAYSAAGVYIVSLTSTVDGWNTDCSDVHTVKISVGLGVTATAVTNVSCFGSANGSVTAAGSGGAPPYVYSLRGLDYVSSNLFSGLKSGTYTLFIKDDVGCIKTTSFTISQPAVISITSATATNASCGNADGSILVAASGGTGALQYKLNAGSYQSSGSFSNLSAGTYQAFIKDANGCLNATFINVNDQGAPSLSVISTTNVSCNNGNDGSIVLSGSGGAGTLQYSIDGGANYQTSGNFPNLAADKYALLVKDAAGCKNGKSLTITQPSVIEFDLGASAAKCYGANDGAIDVSNVTGGIGTFTYSVNGTNYQSEPHFQNLQSGTYTVYVKDVASCIKTSSIAVGQPTIVSASVTSSNESCNFSNDGSITVIGAGGSGNYKYSINDHSFQPTGVFDNLEAGTYKIIVEDGATCPYTTSVTLGQPAVVNGNTVTGNSTCGNSNGSILVVASGGSGAGYQYSLDGITYTSSGSFTGKSAGTYYIYIMDGNGCKNIVSATINDSNGPVLTSTSHTDISCWGTNDGSITINTVTGGTGTLEYSINGENWKTAGSFTGLYAGTYTVVVKDANGCTGTEVITLTQPNRFVINTTVSNVLCNGSQEGSVDVAASGGSGTMAYSINGGFSFQSSPTFDNLSAGDYTVIVRDGAGCIGTETVAVAQPHAINVFAGALYVSCYGASDGEFSLSAFGGTGSFQYSIDGINYQSANVFTGLPGGTYTAYVKDANNCVKTKSITIIEPAAMAINSSLSDVSCHGGSNGVIDLSVTGGVSGYNFEWSSGSVTEDVFNLYAGVYNVTVTDANGCSKTDSYLINEPSSPLIINGVIAPASTASSSDGAVDITVTGGTAPYSYSWSNSSTNADLTNLQVGTYTINITDGHGCTTSNVFTVYTNLGVANNDNSTEHIVVYPNPANDKVLIESNDGVIQKLKIMNVLGQVVFESEPKNQKVELYTTSLEQGAYFVQVYLENTIITKKLKVIK